MKKLLVVVVGVVMLGGCFWDDPDRGFKDTSVEPESQQDSRPPHMINMPNDFMNIAFKCNGKDGIYAHTRDAAPVIIPNDPECVGAG